MDRRLELQTILEGIVDRVYFQPPDSTKIEYPCIVYALEGIFTNPANNKNYMAINRYSMVYIDRDPDSEAIKELIMLPMTRFDRFYRSDSLNHWSFEIYY